MNWSVMLGPDNKPVPEKPGLWDKYREEGKINVWDVYCKRVQHFGAGSYYKVFLIKSGMKPIVVGDTIYSPRAFGGWSAFGSHGFQPVQGFKTRRDAITYMLIARGLSNQRW